MHTQLKWHSKLGLAALVVSGVSLGLSGAASAELIGVEQNQGAVFSLNTTTGAATLKSTNPTMSRPSGLAQAPDGTLYTVADPFIKQLYTINPSTGVGTPGATINAPGLFNSLAFSSTGDLYGFGQAAGQGKELYRINATTGAATLVGVPAPNTNFTELAFSKTGTLYAWGADPAWGLSTINLSTGQATSIGNPNNVYLTSMAFDENGTLWGYDTAGAQPLRNRMLTIDLATGAATAVSPQSGALQAMSAFYFVAPVPIPAAVWLFGSGLAAVLGFARRKKGNQQAV